MDTNKSVNDLKKKERFTWNLIKRRIADLDSSFASLARLHGLKKQTLAQVKHHPYPKCERLIAASIGLDPWDLWPERYNEAHNPARISAHYPRDKKTSTHWCKTHIRGGKS